ncbi:MAG: zeta toxin family protein, partial [Candidatus Brocadiaceae bacterium]|nr:zeta toxin family protein [Candidatus Brocadiaceae bacterium]
MGNLNFLLCPAAIFVIFMKFASYKKLNRDIIILYMGLVFSVLVVLVPPMPGWYYWSLPFIVYFFVRKEDVSVLPFIVYNVAYLMYFLMYEHSDLFSAWKLVSPQWASLPAPCLMLTALGFDAALINDVTFTILQSSLLVIVFWMYTVGVRSNEVYRPKEKPVMIGIGGDSGAGKDTTVGILEKILGEKNVIRVSGDDSHKWARGDKNWEVYTHLNPKGSKLHLQLDHAIALQSGKSIYKGSYDHNTGTFTNPQKVESNKYIFFAGLHPFYLDKMRQLFDIKIFMEPDERLRSFWKIKRDVLNRNYSREQVQAQLEKRRGDSKKYIKPQRDFADIVINFVPA